MRITCSSGNFKVADCQHNKLQIISALEQASYAQADFLLFSELSLTGYSCGDLFYNQDLLAQAQSALQDIMLASKDKDVVTIFGLPVTIHNALYDCAAVIYNGVLLGLVPKTYLSNSNACSEKRYFASSFALKAHTLSLEYNRLFPNSASSLSLTGQQVPVGQTLLFYDRRHQLTFGIELGEDLWSPIPKSSVLCAHGAQVIFNLSADIESVARVEARHDVMQQLSGLQKSIYVYCSGGREESTTDVLYSDYKAVFDVGTLVAESNEQTNLTVDVDLLQCCSQRKKVSFYNTENRLLDAAVEPHWVYFAKEHLQDHIGSYKLVREPFLSGLPIATACTRICEMQQLALLKRMQYMQRQKLIIGVSGGMDSTVALLSCVELFNSQHLPLTDIIGVNMPGAGTSARTLKNATELMAKLQIISRNIQITAAVEAHLKNISHPEQLFDITYEQTQSRERTKILMDLANQENGIVIGTGDMSEFALGWMSYAGDHISMYAINSGLPKTVVKSLLNWYSQRAEGELQQILEDIVHTPISPELLPLDENGVQQQSTESLVGSYLIHDFFLYHLITEGCGVKQLYSMACLTFTEFSQEAIWQQLEVFIKRFFTRQYKRSCFSDGVQLLDAGLSPRGYWRMPSDAECALWLKELQDIKEG